MVGRYVSSYFSFNNGGQILGAKFFWDEMYLRLNLIGREMLSWMNVIGDEMLLVMKCFWGEMF